jgi:DNA-binding NtrC family response regulator
LKGARIAKLVLTHYLQAYDWQDNIRELQNVADRAVILCDGETFAIEEFCLPPEPRRASRPQVPPTATLVDKEREMIEAALESHRPIFRLLGCRPEARNAANDSRIEDQNSAN